MRLNLLVIASIFLALTLGVAGSATAGTSFIDIFVPDGQTQATFWLQGISEATGSVTITASNDAEGLFSSGSRVVEILEPVLDISGLLTSTTALSGSPQWSTQRRLPGSFTALPLTAKRRVPPTVSR